MQFGIKVPGTPCGTPGCRWDVSYQIFPPTHETAPLFLYKHVILATHSFYMGVTFFAYFDLLTHAKLIGKSLRKWAVSETPGYKN